MRVLGCAWHAMVVLQCESYLLEDLRHKYMHHIWTEAGALQIPVLGYTLYIITYKINPNPH